MIRTSLLALWFVGIGLIGPSEAQETEAYPTRELKSELSSLMVLPIDLKHGFYRGTRFDATSVLYRWKFGQHTLFDSWKDNHNPLNHDDITGPCEEFRGEPGYAETRPGEPFLKIGVGLLKKVEEPEYRFWFPYEVLDRGSWNFESTSAGIRQRHRLIAPTLGYGYLLTREISLKDDGKKSVLTFKNCLENLGTKPLSTQVYNHNFFNVDRDTIGPSYELHFETPVQAAGAQERFRECVTIEAQQLKFHQPLDRGSIFSDLTATPPGQLDYRFKMKHLPTKLVLEVASDQKLSKFQLWGVSRTLCPEPYFIIEGLQPNAKHIWTTTYILSKND